MGIFDIFTGNPVKEAAAKNADLYQQNEQKGLGYLDTGYNTATGALNNGIRAYKPLTSLGENYYQAPLLQLDALGVNGTAGSNRALSAFQESPGYQYQLQQGLQAVDRGAASRGMLSSGNTLQAEQTLGNNLANQGFSSWLNNLGTFTAPALTATAGGAYGTQQGYNNLANLGEMDAQNRVNLGTTTTSGLANSNMQAANAQMQGSGNLFNFALNAFSPTKSGASPASGFLSFGKSLFGL